MRRVCLAAGLLASAGCSKILGLDDVTRSDAGTTDIDAAIVAPPNTVVGKSTNRFLQVNGVKEAPRDMSAIVVAALIPDAAAPGKFTVVNGVGKADGTFTISPVPDGVEYILKLDRSYFVTTQHVIDYHLDNGYRGDPTPTPLSGMAFYDFNITGLSRAVNGPEGVVDEMQINSFALGYQGDVTPPKNNATTLTTSYDWSTGLNFYGLPTSVPDPAQGDDVWLMQYRTENIINPSSKRGHTTRTLQSAFELPNLPLTSGAHTAETGAATAVTTTSTVMMNISRGGFDASYDNYTSVGQFGSSQIGVDIYAAPVANDSAIGASLVTVYFDDWSRSPTLSENVGVAYGDPFPASWFRALSLTYIRTRWILVPGTTSARFNFAFMTKVSSYAGGTPTLTPGLLPPGNVKIAGQPSGAGGKVAFDGTTPVTVSWTGVASAKLYQVIVQRAYANGSATRTQTTGALYTTKTSIDIPAEVFSGGEFFVINVTSIQSPSDYAAGNLWPNGLPSQFATYPSGMFRLSATCGNGTMDANEACDANGESATCDVDCTARACGDGLRNMAAGEACDTIQDTPGCDKDCTLPVCGDGYINKQAGEDCDDGNTMADGNGCSATCKLNNICGNGIVEAAAGEQCDPGAQGVNSATCDSDCTAVGCGDGHPNSAAGEMCDDGNADDTDGCKQNCMP